MADKMIPGVALDYIKNKNLKPAFSYKDVWNEEHAASFTVAKAMQVDVLFDIKGAVEKAIENGESFEQFKKNLKPTLQQKGWWGKKEMIDPLTGKDVAAQLGSDRRLKTIYNTNLRSAYQKGQYDRTMASPMHPYLMYRIGQSKNHREQHASWDGLILAKTDPFWNQHFPPNGWGCKCYTVAVSEYRKQQLEQNGIPVAQSPDGTDDANIPVKNTVPKINYKVYSNPRKGSLERVPEGVAPGFGWNPSIARDKQVERVVGDRLKTAEQPLFKKLPVTKKPAEVQKMPEVFTPAKTIKEANKYATDVLGAKIADFTGCGMVSANKWNEAVQKNLEQFPELRSRLKFHGSITARNAMIKQEFIDTFVKDRLPELSKKYAHIPTEELQSFLKTTGFQKLKEILGKDFFVTRNVSGQSWFPAGTQFEKYCGIAIGKGGKDAAKFELLKAFSVQQKFHPVGCFTIKSTVDHEVAHQLDTMLDLSKNKDIITLYNSLTHTEITNGLSSYAWDNGSSNPIQEFIAEGWAEFNNNPTPRPVAVKIGNTVLEVYQKWTKKNL